MKKISRIVPLAVLLATVLATQAKNVSEGLVAYWPFDTTNVNGTTPDLAFTNTMNVIGGPVVGPGQRGNALTFVGPTTYLTNGHTADNTATGLPIYRAGAYTVMMWVNGTNQTAKYLYAEAGLASNNPLLILQTGAAAANNAKLDVIVRNDAGTTLVNHPFTSAVVFDGTWHHIAWVDNRGSVKIYVDGNLDLNSANFNYVPAGVFTMETSAIGTLVRGLAGIATGNIFNGQLDEVAVWERALSQDEVNQVRTNGITTPIVAQVPSLYSVPADQVRRQGDWALFSVEAYGNRPYVTTFQWSSNGVPILGATSRTFQTPPGLQTNNSGDRYNVAVANGIGPAAATTNATLTVLGDAAPDATNGLVNYWPLDVYGATTNSAELHFGHYMQMVGFNTNFDIVAGQFGNAAAFLAVPVPGTYGYRVGGSPIYSRTNYTVSLWVNSAILQADRRVFSEGRNGAGTNNNPLFTLGTDNLGTTPTATVFVRSDAGVGTALTGRRSTRTVFDGVWHQGAS